MTQSINSMIEFLRKEQAVNLLDHMTVTAAYNQVTAIVAEREAVAAQQSAASQATAVENGRLFTGAEVDVMQQEWTKLLLTKMDEKLTAMKEPQPSLVPAVQANLQIDPALEGIEEIDTTWGYVLTVSATGVRGTAKGLADVIRISGNIVKTVTDGTAQMIEDGGDWAATGLESWAGKQKIQIDKA